MSLGRKIGIAVAAYLGAGVATMLLAARRDRQFEEQTGRKPFLAPSSDPVLFALGTVFWPAAWYDEAKGRGGLGLLPQKKP